MKHTAINLEKAESLMSLGNGYLSNFLVNHNANIFIL